MATDIVMPRLSDSMEEGTVLKWLKSVGDEVQRGEDLVEIETDKANMTYASDTGGVLAEIVAGEGDTLPVGEVIARIEAGGDAPADPAEKAVTEDREPEGAREAEAREEAKEVPGKPEERERDKEAAPPPPKAEERRIKASPLARRLARERGVNPAQLEGSGPGGRIVKADIEAAAEAPVGAAQAIKESAAARAAATAEAAEPAQPTAKGDVETKELRRSQQTVARRMSESKATAPHFYLQMEIDMGAAVDLRDQLKDFTHDNVVPTYNDMVVKATAIALREFPLANGSYRDGRFELHSRVNIGVAVAGDQELIVPTVFDADKKSLGEIAEEARELIEKVRSGTITPPELSGGTFTVSNLGMFGIDNFAAVINPPQAAMLAVGAIKKRVVAGEDGEITAREMMGVTLSCDHRILYGDEGSRFLGKIKEILEEPLALTL